MTIIHYDHYSLISYIFYMVFSCIRVIHVIISISKVGFVSDASILLYFWFWMTDLARHPFWAMRYTHDNIHRF